ASVTQLRGAVAALPTERAYAVIAEQILADTGATGVAIALDANGEILCRASAGDAPPIDVAVKRDSGLSGHCLRQRETIYCEDTQTDPRVDAAVCAEMNLRSVLIAPVFARTADNEIIGVVEVFSDEPRHFPLPVRRYVQETCALVAEIASPVPQPAPMRTTMVAEPAPVVERTPMARPAIPEPAIAEAISAPMFASAVSDAPAWSTWSDHARNLSSRVPVRVVAVGAGAVIALAAILYGPTHRSTPAASTAIPAGGPVSAATTAPHGAAPANSAVPAAVTSSASVPSIVTKRHARSALAAPAPEQEALKVASGRNSVVLPESDEPTTTLAPMLARNNTSIPAGILDANLPAVPARAPQFAGGHLLQKVTPRYPAGANFNARSSSVHLAAVVGRDGHVISVRGESGAPSLVSAAQDAVRQWLYEPFTVDGKPVEAKVQIVINFHVTDVR
ncbi:MAG TPA: energy transducer TonB, partial [Terriglobales bacterium]